MAKLTPSQQAAEISVRITVAALQVLAIVSGALLMELTGHKLIAEIYGGGAIAVGSLVLINEVIMIIFAAKNVQSVHHSARLLVDLVLKVAFTTLIVLAILGLIVIAVILFVYIQLEFEAEVAAIFAVPVVLGTLLSIAFIVSAVTSGIISSRLGTNGTVTTVETIVTQPLQDIVVATPPQTIYTVVPAQYQPVGYQPAVRSYQPPSGYYQPSPGFQAQYSGDSQMGCTKPKTIH